MSSSREPGWMRWRPPWDDWGREWLEWVDEEETDSERECMGRKSSEEGIICMLSAVMRERLGCLKTSAAGQRQRTKEKNKKKAGKKETSVGAPVQEAGRKEKTARRRLADDDN